MSSCDKCGFTTCWDVNLWRVYLWMWHCVKTVAWAPRDCKVHLFYLDQNDCWKWRLCGRNVRKRMRVLGLARAPRMVVGNDAYVAECKEEDESSGTRKSPEGLGRRPRAS